MSWSQDRTIHRKDLLVVSGKSSTSQSLATDNAHEDIQERLQGFQSLHLPLPRNIET